LYDPEPAVDVTTRRRPAPTAGVGGRARPAGRPGCATTAATRSAWSRSC